MKYQKISIMHKQKPWNEAVDTRNELPLYDSNESVELINVETVIENGINIRKTSTIKSRFQSDKNLKFDDFRIANLIANDMIGMLKECPTMPNENELNSNIEKVEKQIDNVLNN